MTTLKTAARETNAVLGVFCCCCCCFFVCLFCFVLFCFFAFMFYFFLIPISRKPMLRYETYTHRHCSVWSNSIPGRKNVVIFKV